MKCQRNASELSVSNMRTEEAYYDATKHTLIEILFSRVKYSKNNYEKFLNKQLIKKLTGFDKTHDNVYYASFNFKLIFKKVNTKHKSVY